MSTEPFVMKTKPEDFERVHPLLLEFKNPRLTKDDWRRIFSPPWKVDEDYCGYMLVDDEDVVGYLGYIFSRMDIDGSPVKFCNLTTWIVQEKYRGHSLSLFYPAMDLSDYVITDFSPTPAVTKMFEKRYKYRALEHYMHYIYPFPGISLSGKNFTMSFDNDIHADILSEEDRRIYEDHKSLACHHILLESDDGYTYIVAKNKRLRKVRFMEILYMNDVATLSRHAKAVVRKICLKYGVFGLLTEERLMRGKRIPGTYIGKPYVFKLYKTSLPVETHNVTHLYSEKILL